MGTLPQKNAIKSPHLLNRGALSPSSLTAHSYCSRFFGAAGKQQSRNTQIQLTLQCSCIGPELLHLCPEGMAANWTVEDICGHFHTHAK